MKRTFWFLFSRSAFYQLAELLLTYDWLSTEKKTKTQKQNSGNKQNKIINCKKRKSIWYQYQWLFTFAYIAPHRMVWWSNIFVDLFFILFFLSSSCQCQECLTIVFIDFFFFFLSVSHRYRSFTCNRTLILIYCLGITLVTCMCGVGSKKKKRKCGAVWFLLGGIGVNVVFLFNLVIRRLIAKACMRDEFGFQSRIYKKI